MKFADLNKLDFNDSGSWPLGIKVFAIALIAVFLMGNGYWFFIDNQLTALETARLREQQLRRQQIQKQILLPDIGVYREQLHELRQIVSARLERLSTHTEMPDIIEEISEVGKESGLRFERFKPDHEELGDIYTITPILIRARGRYHQFGAFVSGISGLSRIVTLKQVKLISPRPRTNQAPDGGDRLLLIEATLQTYRRPEDHGGSQAAGAPRG
jgi:type IV pilus assembly protein PilO